MAKKMYCVMGHIDLVVVVKAKGVGIASDTHRLITIDGYKDVNELMKDVTHIVGAMLESNAFRIPLDRWHPYEGDGDDSAED